MTPWLTQSEIDDLCEPLTQHAAQLRFIRGLGLTVRTKPNGAPLLMRTHFDAAMAPAAKKPKPAKCQPNSTGLRLAYAKD